jgi:hypothetical protein
MAFEVLPVRVNLVILVSLCLFSLFHATAISYRERNFDKTSNREENFVQCQIRNLILSQHQIRNFLSKYTSDYSQEK